MADFTRNVRPFSKSTTLSLLVNSFMFSKNDGHRPSNSVGFYNIQTRFFLAYPMNRPTHLHRCVSRRSVNLGLSFLRYNPKIRRVPLPNRASVDVLTYSSSGLNADFLLNLSFQYWLPYCLTCRTLKQGEQKACMRLTVSLNGFTPIPLRSRHSQYSARYAV